MLLKKVVHINNKSYRKAFSDSKDWILRVKIDSEKSKFAYLKCTAMCQFTKYERSFKLTYLIGKTKLIIVSAR